MLALMRKLLGDIVLTKETLTVAATEAPALCCICMDGDGPACVTCIPPFVVSEHDMEILI